MHLSNNPTHSLQHLTDTSALPLNLAVIGHPIEHSLSPRMHNAALAVLAERNPSLKSWCYGKFNIRPEELAQALPLFHAKGFLGLNLTVPHKVDVLEQKLAIPASANVVKMGAANTLKWTPEGYIAYNTDAFGMTSAIAESLFNGMPKSLDGRTVVLLGAGGAARAAAFQCLEEGCAELFIVNRNADRLNELVADLNHPCVTGLQPAQAETMTFNASPLLINATSLGLKPDDPLPFDLTSRPEQWRVFDMVYNPPATALLKSARTRGFPAENGRGMLIWQGALALGLWIEPTLERASALATELAPVMRKALQD